MLIICRLIEITLTMESIAKSSSVYSSDYSNVFLEEEEVKKFVESLGDKTYGEIKEFIEEYGARMSYRGYFNLLTPTGMKKQKRPYVHPDFKDFKYQSESVYLMKHLIDKLYSNLVVLFMEKIGDRVMGDEIEYIIKCAIRFSDRRFESLAIFFVKRGWIHGLCSCYTHSCEKHFGCIGDSVQFEEFFNLAMNNGLFRLAKTIWSLCPVKFSGFYHLLKNSSINDGKIDENLYFLAFEYLKTYHNKKQEMFRKLCPENSFTSEKLTKFLMLWEIQIDLPKIVF